MFVRMNNKNDDMSDDNVVDRSAVELIQCPACLRQMRQEVFVKHPNICRKNPTNQRNIRIFDMTQYRSIKAGDKIIPVRKALPVDTDIPNIINVRPSQTRSAKRDRRSDTFMPPVINNFCCPTCKRTFCEKAYDRHVAFCTSKTKQIQQPPSEEILRARLKLDRRMKFGSNRVAATPLQTYPILTTPISTPVINKEPTKQKLPSKPFCLLPLRKTPFTTLAYCPWCSKPYIPNCIHYCRNFKGSFPIQS